MTDAPDNLVLELLRAVRSDLATVKADLHDVKDSVISMREELNAMRRDGLRQERAFATMQVDVDRIKNRLDLQDA